MIRGDLTPNPAFSGRGFAARERGRNFGLKSYAYEGRWTATPRR